MSMTLSHGGRVRPFEPAAPPQFASLLLAWMAGMLCVGVPAGASELVHTLTHTKPNYFDELGISAHIAGNKLFVGAPFDDTAFLDSGAIYAFDKTTGELLARITNPKAEDGDYVGQTISSFDNYLVVGVAGATTDEKDTGAVVLFDLDTFEPVRTMWVPGKTGSYLGHTVATVGSTIIAGAFKDDPGAEKAGSVFVFNGLSGDLLWEFNNPTPAIEDFFGEAVAGSLHRAIVGARQDDTLSADSGAVYVYDLNTGGLLRSIFHPDGLAGAQFGTSVAAQGDKLLIGAPLDGQFAASAGKAFLYDASTGDVLMTLTSPARERGEHFGDSVAFVGNHLLVGAPASRKPGSAYLFDGTTGALLDTFRSPGTGFNDYFGDSVAGLGEDILIGASLYDGGLAASGAAFLFRTQIVLPEIIPRAGLMLLGLVMLGARSTE